MNRDYFSHQLISLWQNGPWTPSKAEDWIDNLLKLWPRSQIIPSSCR